MNYILKTLNQRIDFLESSGDLKSLEKHIQARFEFILVYIIAYLWNKNLNKIEIQDRGFVLQSIIKPTIGSIVSICRSLDIEKEIFTKSKLNEALSDYPSIRNELLGHGFVFEDAPEKVIRPLQKLYDSIQKSKIEIINGNVSLIMVTSLENNVYKGILYKSDGLGYTPWSCPKSITDFKVNSLYGSTQINEYFRLSPFIEINSYGKEIYFFNSIDEKLLGKVKYNQLLETGVFYKEWEELCELDIENDGLKIKSHNGTIRNVYENNYSKYIDIGIKSKLKNFLLKNKSSVCATVWGHGGVGKTATIQSLCEDLANDEKKTFDYIIFISAKDRKYDYYTGRILEINDPISTYLELVKAVNKVLFNNQNSDPEQIIELNGKKIFLVIDDFETFPKEEKDKIEIFISLLNTNHHKVIITTRAANINIGQEFQTNELTEEDSIKFLFEVIKNQELGNYDVVARQLGDYQKSNTIYQITGGRPLFIFQFAFVLGQRGLDEALSYKIKEGETAINFLYGRIYDILSPRAKDLFVVLSLLVNQNDLSNVIEKAQYVLNLEHESDQFNTSVNELVKLKILKLDEERKFFEIYSKEIFQIMSNYFIERSDSFKGNCLTRRAQVNRDKTLDVERSLLLTANANRLAKNEIEAIDSFKQIINRTTSPVDVKIEALLNLASYLVLDKGKRDSALKILEDHRHHFNKDVKKGSKERSCYAKFTKMYATYFWGNGTRDQKQKAINELLEYASLIFDFNDDLDLEIAGMLLQYKSILVINDWQELKERLRYNEVSKIEFQRKRENQKRECKDIHDKHGNILYASVVRTKFDTMSSGAKQNVVGGFYSFIEVLIRLEKYDFGLKICDFVLNLAPSNFHFQFKKKQDWLFQIGRKDPFEKKTLASNDFATILSDALRDKKNN
jgi:hypothetical protein